MTDSGPGSGQGYKEFRLPEHEEIYRRSRVHSSLMEKATTQEGWVFSGMEHLVLCTIGRRSGKEHKVALPIWLDADGSIIVAASNAGAPSPPAWYHNLTDREANPDVLVKTFAGEFRSVPQVLEGEDRTRTWAAFIADRPFYADYENVAGRVIPLVRLAR
jgi:deazaflavin-dependent oxidoreductase (nitroreductase family)